jgi:hypothetical protein
VTENLLDPVGAEVQPIVHEAPEAVDAPPPFTLPTMYKYTDMANLVQMDPIRDFDDSRWPRRRSIGKKPRS